MVRSLVVLCAVGILGGCGDDGGSTDGGPRTDTGGRRDTGPPEPDAGPPPPMCGNALPEAGESCDDGNAMTGDGCAPDCTLEPGCGDRVVMAPETCDDGNHAAGDGCSANCGSDETCGNGTFDFAAGETCDDSNTTDGDGCSSGCTIEACGNSVTDAAAGETCDDGNATHWDGCGLDCRDELSFVADMVATADVSIGCDLNSDGTLDNRFGGALGGLFALFNALLADSISSATLLVVLPFVGLDDPVNDPEVFFGLVHGNDADTDATNNFTGSAMLLALRESLGPDGFIPAPVRGAIASSMLTSGPDDTTLYYRVDPMFPDRLELASAHFSARLESSGGVPTRLDDGLLCGALTIEGLAAAGNPLAGVTGFAAVDGCDGSATTTFADVAVGGASALGFTSRATTPDVDIDRDGLETFEVFRDGPPGCQPTIAACIDGDGTRIEGRDCTSDPRIADGISAAFLFAGVTANVRGITP